MSKVWIDADACPVAVREILFKAARRTGVEMRFVANQAIRLPKVANLMMQVVPKGFDVADHEIACSVQKDDLVITQDIPLAAEVMEAGAQALSPRGEWFSAETIRARLNMRDFLETLRSSGEHTGGPKAMGRVELKQFADALDRWLARRS